MVDADRCVVRRGNFALRSVSIYFADLINACFPLRASKARKYDDNLILAGPTFVISLQGYIYIMCFFILDTAPKISYKKLHGIAIKNERSWIFTVFVAFLWLNGQLITNIHSLSSFCPMEMDLTSL